MKTREEKLPSTSEDVDHTLSLSTSPGLFATIRKAVTRLEITLQLQSYSYVLNIWDAFLFHCSLSDKER